MAASQSMVNNMAEDPTAKAQKYFVVKNLCRYFGVLKAVDDVSFEVREKEIFSLIGPNGAGKTTLFNAVTGVYKATSGDVIYKGKSLVNLAPHKIAIIGLARTFQIVRVFDNMSVLENTQVGFHCRLKSNIWDVVFNTRGLKNEKKEITERGEALLEQVGLLSYKDVLARHLPLGMRKKLQIARALATGPSILLLDEPTGGMNQSEKVEMMKLISKLRDSGLTVLLVEHDMGVIMGISDRIIVLDHGVKIAEGTPTEIQNNEQVIEAYLGKGLNNVHAER